MIYQLIRPPIRFCLRQFFSSVKVAGAARCETGPVMILSNHPNFALDSLVIASCMERPLWFLAKSTIFKGPLLKKFFESCNMVPVHRRIDSPDGTVDNSEMFRVACEVLREGRALAMFPEGISAGERKLMPLKTGAARIAFQTEEAANFGLGLRIQPVGLTYTDLTRFRSAVTVTFGEPIEVRSLQHQYESDAIQAVKGLTATIEAALRDVSVEVSDSKHVELVEKITRVYRTREPKADDHLLMKTIAENVEAVGEADLTRHDTLRSRIDDYLEMSSVFAVDDSVRLEPDYHRMFIWLLVPFLIAGIAINYIPYKFIGRTAKRLTSHPVHAASFKLGLGVAVFSAWYVLLTAIFALTAGGFVNTMLFILVMLFSSYAVNNYLSQFKLYLLSSLWPGSKKPLDILKMIRDQLVEELNSFRVR